MYSTSNDFSGSWVIIELCDLSKFVENWVSGITVDNNETVYFTTGESGLWKLNRTIYGSEPQRLAKTDDGSEMRGIVWDGNNTLYICNSNHHKIMQYDIDSENLSTLVGSENGHQDGDFEVARFYYPWGICMDNSSNLFITDCHHVRKISLQNKTVETVAGSTSANAYGGFKDGESSTARFASPSGIVLDKNDNIYVCDGRNHCIRKIKDGVVSTVVGTPAEKGSKDGSLRMCQFKFPKGLVVDENGNLIISDSLSLRKANFAKNCLTTPFAWQQALELASCGEICGIPFYKNGNLFLGTVGIESSYNLLVLQPRWKIVRLLWIAHHKEDKSTCLLAWLPKDLIKEINSFLTTSKKHTLKIADLKQ